VRKYRARLRCKISRFCHPGVFAVPALANSPLCSLPRVRPAVFLHVRDPSGWRCIRRNNAGWENPRILQPSHLGTDIITDRSAWSYIGRIAEEKSNISRAGCVCWILISRRRDGIGTDRSVWTMDAKCKEMFISRINMWTRFRQSRRCDKRVSGTFLDDRTDDNCNRRENAREKRREREGNTIIEQYYRREYIQPARVRWNIRFARYDPANDWRLQNFSSASSSGKKVSVCFVLWTMFGGTVNQKAEWYVRS